jgi:hypothetical protein
MGFLVGGSMVFSITFFPQINIVGVFGYSGFKELNYRFHNKRFDLFTFSCSNVKKKAKWGIKNKNARAVGILNSYTSNL